MLLAYAISPYGFEFEREGSLVLWLLGSLVLGWLCGIAAFTSDRNGDWQLLASQGCPVGVFLAVRTGFLLIVLCVTMALAWHGGTNSGDPVSWVNDRVRVLSIRLDKYPADSLDPLLLIIMAPLYGFCFGHLFGMLICRPIIAAPLSLLFATVSVAIWAPSILNGGVHAWHVFVVPVILLLITRFSMRKWVAGQWRGRRSIVGLSAVIICIVLGFGAVFWLRATEVPNVPDPFDVRAYIASVSPLTEYESAAIFREALSSCESHRERVEQQLGWPTDSKSMEILKRREDGKRRHGGEDESLQSAYRQLFFEVLNKGWTDNRDVDRWLNEMFKGDWAVAVEKALQLPLGVLQDPRVDGLENWNACAICFAHKQSEFRVKCGFIFTLFKARAVQLQARGDLQGAMRQFDSLLAMCRLSKNCSTMFDIVNDHEKSVLVGYCLWLEKVGPDPALLRAGLEMLRRHDAANPSFVNNIKSEFLAHNKPELYVYRSRLFWAEWLPWEVERQKRIQRANLTAQIRFVDEPVWKTAERKATSDSRMKLAINCGFPLENGPGADIDLGRWADWLANFPYPIGFGWFSQVDSARSQRCLNADIILTAMALYQIDHGRAPAGIDDLVPEYLASASYDPVRNGSFQFRIAEEKQIKRRVDGFDVFAAPGQRVIFSPEVAARYYDPKEFWLPVPSWVK